MSSLACLLCMLMSLLRHADVIIIRVSHVGRVNWYSGRVSPSGRRRRVGRVCARGQTPCRRVMESAAMSDVRFWRRFHQWLRLGLLYTVVWSKHNFDNFHFLAKIKHPFKPCALIPIVGVHPRERESILLEIRERIQNKDMEEEDHFTQTLLPTLIAALAAAAMAARLLPLQPFTFSLHSSHSHPSLYHCALSRMPINRQVWWLLFFNNSSCIWVDTFVNGGCNYHWQMVTLLLRVGCPIIANPNII